DAVRSIKPRAFVAENVPGLLNPKFAEFVENTIESPLGKDYEISKFVSSADGFGVPQSRRRVFFVGIRKGESDKPCQVPGNTHVADDCIELGFLRCSGVREALGLPSSDYDTIAPTLRSGFTGPR